MNRPIPKSIAAALIGITLLAGCGEKKSAEELQAEAMARAEEAQKEYDKETAAIAAAARQFFTDPAAVKQALSELEKRPEVQGKKIEAYQFFTLRAEPHRNDSGRENAATLSLNIRNIVPGTKESSSPSAKEAKIIGYTYSVGGKSWTGPEGVRILNVRADTENGYFPVNDVDFSVLPAIVAEADKIAKEKNPVAFNNGWNSITYEVSQNWTPAKPAFVWAVRYEKNHDLKQTPVIVFFSPDGKLSSVSEK
ncbi:Uncharacterised protein [Kingella potus]|uniref:Lipoprotein n=1 Tax=Kingella potus TaxID=265175 RepID=A0A377R3M4_9NEIS|nr:hypothetical protein [Kingella potus]UOP00732.1 hypothetical protein LVJ84_13260 [Kingella potus]STR02869.1 Uncharacterised protein [Kingella potus]